MKKKFIGYYNPTEREINDSWTKGIFSFDANTLLNLYRYSEGTRIDFVNALKAIKNKLFLPYQAAFEFHNNRLSVIDGIEYSYTFLNEIFKSNFEKNLEAQINQFKKHPAIKIDNILNLYSEFLNKIADELSIQKKLHPDFKTKDIVLDDVTDLFENVIGREYSKQELNKIYEEGKIRYSEGIPPGYKDLENKKKRGERHVYGDLLIWKELIEYTIREKLPLIFVTDDRKDDWWKIENGKTVRPREELIKEFFDLTGIRILIYNADNFLHIAKKRNLIPKLKEDTLKEVKEIRVSDEQSYATLKDIKDYTYSSPKIIRDLLNERITQQKTISDLLNEGVISRPKTINDLINEGVISRPKTINDLINEGVITQPNAINNLLNDRITQNKVISDLLNERITQQKTISELLKEGTFTRPTTTNKSIVEPQQNKESKKSKSKRDDEK